MRHPTLEAVRTHVALQERLFRAATPGCQATGRSAHCPTCGVQRIVYDLPSTGDIVGCGTCGTEFSLRPRAISVAPDFQWPDLVKVRTARKAHRCAMPRENPVIDGKRGRSDRPSPYYRRWDGGRIPLGHADLIEAGEQYVEYFGETPAYQSGQRFCGACAVAAGIAVEAAS